MCSCLNPPPQSPIKYKFLNIFLPIYGTLIGTTNPSQSESESNSNEVVTPYFLDLQNWSLTIKCNLVLYPGHFFFLKRNLSPQQENTECIANPTNRKVKLSQVTIHENRHQANEVIKKFFFQYNFIFQIWHLRHKMKKKKKKKTIFFDNWLVYIYFLTYWHLLYHP